MGNAIDALQIIMNEVKVRKDASKFKQFFNILNPQDTKMAIKFCHEHDDVELWEHLIDKSTNKSEIVTQLLMDSMSSFFINPEVLINRIDEDQEIVDLKNALTTMLHNYETQVDENWNFLEKFR